MSGTNRKAPSSVVRLVVGLILTIGYPAFVYLALERLGPRAVSVVLLVVLVPVFWWRVRAHDRETVKALAIVPAVTLVALVLGATLDAAGGVLLVPVAINAALLTAFGATLFGGRTPMIERFARLVEPELSEAKLRWCRRWTWVWVSFFVFNGGLALALALFAPVRWWALYNGLVAYVLIGLLFAIEWVARRLLFGPSATGGST